MRLSSLHLLRLTWSSSKLSMPSFLRYGLYSYRVTLPTVYASVCPLLHVFSFSFIDLVFLGGMAEDEGQKAAGIVVVLLLWRIARVVDGSFTFIAIHHHHYHYYHQGRFKGGGGQGTPPVKILPPLCPPNEVYDKA